MKEPKYRVGDTVITYKISDSNIVFEAHEIKRVWLEFYYSDEFPPNEQASELLRTTDEEWHYSFNEIFLPESQIIEKL